MNLSDLIDNPNEILGAWPAEPRLFHRDPKTLHSLLTLHEVDKLVDNDCLPMRNLAVLKEGRVFEAWEYWDPDDHDMPRRGLVRKHINDGGSISLRSLERMVPAVAEMYREVRAETGYGVHANAYLTPAGAQGLKYHFDPYLTLVLQLHGRKTWPLHPPIMTNPVQQFGIFRGWTDEQRHRLANTPPAQSYTLQPGDVFWLPRGWIHSPYTEGHDTSLHITLAVKERTYWWLAAQLAQDVLQRALPDPQMREELPPAVVTAGAADGIETARQYLVGALLLLDREETVKYIQQQATR